MLHERGIGRRQFAANIASVIKKVAAKKGNPTEGGEEISAEEFIAKGKAFSGLVDDCCPRDIDEYLR